MATSIMQLPSEIRLMIFELVFHTAAVNALLPLSLHAEDKLLKVKKGPIGIELNRTCRRFYYECKDLLPSYTILRLLHREDSPVYSTASLRISDEACQYIENVSIKFRPEDQSFLAVRIAHLLPVQLWNRIQRISIYRHADSLEILNIDNSTIIWKNSETLARIVKEMLLLFTGLKNIFIAYEFHVAKGSGRSKFTGSAIELATLRHVLVNEIFRILDTNNTGRYVRWFTEDWKGEYRKLSGKFLCMQNIQGQVIEDDHPQHPDYFEIRDGERIVRVFFGSVAEAREHISGQLPLPTIFKSEVLRN